MSETLEALNAAQNSWDFFANKSPKCPHCGADHPMDDVWFLYNEDGPHEVECPTCERPYLVRSQATWTFSTDEQETP